MANKTPMEIQIKDGVLVVDPKFTQKDNHDEADQLFDSIKKQMADEYGIELAEVCFPVREVK